MYIYSKKKYITSKSMFLKRSEQLVLNRIGYYFVIKETKYMRNTFLNDTLINDSEGNIHDKRYL